MNDTIWVVDDDRSVRFVLATALSEAGFEVVGFDAAAAVLDALATRPPPQLLFTDVRMPGDDGLRSEEHTSELQSLMRMSYAVFCSKKKQNITRARVLSAACKIRHVEHKQTCYI